MESETTGVFNIGSGQSTTIDELARVIIDILGHDLYPIYKEARLGDIRSSLADITLARLCGYHPRYSLENGLRETLNSYLIGVGDKTKNIYNMGNRLE
jgi:UDP-glucose 4-epimerase